MQVAVTATAGTMDPPTRPHPTPERYIPAQRGAKGGSPAATTIPAPKPKRLPGRLAALGDGAESELRRS